MIRITDYSDYRRLLELRTISTSVVDKLPDELLSKLLVSPLIINPVVVPCRYLPLKEFRLVETDYPDPWEDLKIRSSI